MTFSVATQLSEARVAEILGKSFEDGTRCNCHAASLAIVRSGALGTPGEEVRVARGFCRGVIGQHSWIAMSRNPYEYRSWIVDVSLWSYDPALRGRIWRGQLTSRGRHTPHRGASTIWTAGKPVMQTGPPITLTPSRPLSADARVFLGLVEPLDRAGWSALVHSPVRGWPAAEIISAAYETPAISALVPIDIVGMLTDHNPGGLYW